MLDERQEMDAGVTKVNVHQVGAAALEERRQELIFPAVDNRRRLFHELQPTVPERVKARLRNHLDVFERKALHVLEPFRHDERVVTLERTHLPVNVEHFRFEECGAVAGYDGLTHLKSRDLPRGG